MPKTKKLPRNVTLASRVTAAVVLGLLISYSTYPGVKKAIAAASCSSTADCQAKINDTNNAISNSQQQLSALSGQAVTYQQAIAGLQAQISDLQSKIVANQSQQASLKQQITDAQAQLDHEKSVLSDILRTMYIDGQMTTIEELATSNKLSDYVDKEAYRQQVQVSVQSAMDKIAALQADLRSKKDAVDKLLSEQQAQQDQLAYAKQQQNNMLSYNQSQQAAYNQQLASSRSDLSSLKSRLAALNTTSDSRVSYSGTCGGGYPASATNQRGGHWGCNYAQDNTVDNWNMLNRECVSYTAFMVSQTYGISTSGWGSAYKWISAARAHGFTVDQTPAAGTVAIRDADYSEPGDVGHAMWVVSARSSSDITVQEYNQHMDGKYQQRTFNPQNYSAPVYYIHFR